VNVRLAVCGLGRRRTPSWRPPAHGLCTSAPRSRRRSTARPPHRRRGEL